MSTSASMPVQNSRPSSSNVAQVAASVAPPNVMEAATMWSAYLVKRYQAALQDATANQDLGQLVYSEAIPKQVLALLRPRGAML